MVTASRLAIVEQPHCRRSDRLTAQKVEVGIVFQEMLGVEDAAEYFATYNLPSQIVERILGGIKRRRNVDCWR
ncbi:hypothetical protein [Duganella sp. BJB476]|uniref:hypothetical protein n=1 Tax=Duganella sp. BJB476 TaxID=1871176 RepID=UPI000E35191C|nr:hypothetical protein [Duganella sp. BJB476]RFP32405.1 hypothetical protein D0T21_09375 [Duganella sp. BJB476]